MKKPIHFLIFKILGILLLALGIFAITLLIRGFGDFETNNFMIGTLLLPFTLGGGIACTAIGWQPELSKMSVKTARYIQTENKEDLTAVATGTAEIVSEAAATVAGEVASRVAEATRAEKKFCKHCGASIDRDSKFCSECGKEQ